MQRLTCLLLVALGGCPEAPRYVVTDVYVHRAPVEGALVAADCGHASRLALRTDDTGRARLALRGAPSGDRCTLTVAKPQLRTVEITGVSTCTAPLACPPMAVEMVEVPR